MAITHLAVDDYVRLLVLDRLAIMYNPCYNEKYAGQIGDLRCHIFQLPSSRELGRSGALAACTNKVDGHHRAILKFKVVPPFGWGNIGQNSCKTSNPCI
jgi:hypothetical protein